MVETQGKALIEQLRRIAGEKHLCMEEGALSEWLFELLEPYVKRIVVVQPAERTGSKSDEKDGWDLCERLRRDAL
ncbi:MAG TPA: hypothetical protein VFA70_02650, partial [Dehalococcoidia bacterium]|nr:hypothetical protein [Dehalococcoidia bacterium]